MARTLSFLFAAALAGCVPFGLPAPLPERGRCDNGIDFSGPSENGVYERKKPENPVAIGGGEATGFGVRALTFIPIQWAESVFPTLPAREAPVLSGGVIVCAFAVGRTPNVDGIDGPSDPIVSISTPDLLVWADFAGTKASRGPSIHSREATFAFEASLKQGDPVSFAFGDFDLLSPNDYIGRIEGRYPGKVPFTIRGKGGGAVCNALSPERMAAEARAAEKQVDVLLAELEAFEPTMEQPDAGALGMRIGEALGVIEYFRGSAEPALSSADARVREASGKHRKRYLALVARLGAGAPPAGEWVTVGELAEARVIGLRCQTGDKLVHQCLPEVEIRLRRDPDGALCRAGGDTLGALGTFGGVRADGRSSGALMDHVQIGERWLKNQRELEHLPKGTVLRMGLFFGGTFWRPTNDKWDIPLVRIGKTYLRVD